MVARPLAVGQARGRGLKVRLDRLRIAAELLVDLSVAREAALGGAARARQRELVVEVDVADLLDLVAGQRDDEVQVLIFRSGR